MFVKCFALLMQLARLVLGIGGCCGEVQFLEVPSLQLDARELSPQPFVQGRREVNIGHEIALNLPVKSGHMQLVAMFLLVFLSKFRRSIRLTALVDYVVRMARKTSSAGMMIDFEVSTIATESQIAFEGAGLDTWSRVDCIAITRSVVAPSFPNYGCRQDLLQVPMLALMLWWRLRCNSGFEWIDILPERQSHCRGYAGKSGTAVRFVPV